MTMASKEKTKANWLIILLLMTVLPAMILIITDNIKLGQIKDLSLKDISTNNFNEKTLIASSVLPIHRWESVKETPVYFVPTEGLPIVDIKLSFFAGSARDADRPGLSRLVLNSLREGTAQLSNEQIVEQFENAGAIYEISSNQDQASIHLRLLADSPQLKPVVELLSKVVSEPIFPKDNIEQLKERQVLQIQHSIDNPREIAQQQFLQAIYLEHPYANPVLGIPQYLEQISEQDIIAFHKKYYVAQNAVLTIVGGIDYKLAEDISDTLIGALPQGKVAEDLPEVTIQPNKIERRIKIASKQSHVLLGQPSIKAGEADFIPLILGNHILGGTETARLFRQLQEKKQAAFDVQSEFKGLVKSGPFKLSIQTQTNQVDEIVALLKASIEEFVKFGPDEAELEVAKKQLLGAFPLSLSSNLEILEVVSHMAFYKLPNDFLDQYGNRVEKVTKEDIAHAFQKRLQPEQMTLVVVGEQKTT